MKQLFIILLVALSSTAMAQGKKSIPQPSYDKYFTPERLRVDLVFAGDAASQHIYLDGLKKESSWSGSKINLIHPFHYGEYYMEVREMLLAKKGYTTLDRKSVV